MIPSLQRARIGAWSVSLASSAFGASISFREAGHKDNRNKVWKRSILSSSPFSQPVLLCLDELYMLSHPQDFHTSILAARRTGLLGQKEGISVLWEEMRRIYVTSLYSWVATIPISLPLPISMFGLPRVMGEKSWESNPGRMEGTYVVSAPCKVRSFLNISLWFPMTCGWRWSFWVPLFWGEHSQRRAASSHSVSMLWHFMWDMLGDPFSFMAEGHGKSQWAWVKSLLHWRAMEACDLSEPLCFCEMHPSMWWRPRWSDLEED